MHAGAPTPLRQAVAQLMATADKRIAALLRQRLDLIGASLSAHHGGRLDR